MNGETNEFIRQSLHDSGFQEYEINRFICLIENSEKKTSYKVLKKQRYCLLDKIHLYQKMIDCLDYFIRKMKKEGFISDE